MVLTGLFIMSLEAVMNVKIPPTVMIDGPFIHGFLISTLENRFC